MALTLKPLIKLKYTISFSYILQNIEIWINWALACLECFGIIEEAL